jgi:type II secretory pathway pseudopilin PulG
MKHRRDAGFSLAALIFFATAVSILLGAAVPAYQMQARREREEELIFRGQEYTRAIQKYQRKFGIYPPSIDALVQTNGLRFVRKLYTDPITGKEFRLISINPDGSVSGSTLFTQRVNNVPLFGAGPQVFGQSPPPQNPQTGQNPQVGQNPQTGQNPQLRGNPIPSSSGNSSVAPGLNVPPANQANSRLNGASPPAGSGNSGNPSAAGGIIGVASDSPDSSIMVYNNRQKYNEWEFVAILGQSGQTNAPANGQTPALPNGQTPASPSTPPQGNRQPEPQPFKRP